MLIIKKHLEWGETDPAQIVFYPNYFRWFDAAGHELFKYLGIPLKKLMETENIILPILNVSAKFIKPLKYDDDFEIRPYISKINEKTIEITYEVYKDNVLHATGSEIRGWVNQNGEKLKLINIDEKFIKILNKKD
ncbi:MULTISPECIES: thioesterase family protein [Acidiplasma]|jgi:acyl-CoA thioester hydrolase|uniref:Uncharacterized protein n=2 Tax=Acidiplasma TaxID=507753 RepID=A0A0Q0RU25_9ARCH|nr:MULTISPECIES: thioesterase family protein [Acidiplasma]KJE49947.1 hypothetical protein TZ01_02445 [Acidiplasma sp. MBA-1]KPV42731.1 hypothetical protein SE19_09160 [Acidiplasma aeolicum]KQB35850.1 hypothetical protein AOG55_05665 [Acidiplasma cupricumulans]KQB36114.1 hypothetical protein AOG54_08020 [Acidiplasma aeolicum]WMT55140.1 MAG: thioesterase family protein [Acidiplasma sp.]